MNMATVYIAWWDRIKGDDFLGEKQFFAWDLDLEETPRQPRVVQDERRYPGMPYIEVHADSPEVAAEVLRERRTRYLDERYAIGLAHYKKHGFIEVPNPSWWWGMVA